MQFNVFEGARRIVKVITWLLVIGFAVAFIQERKQTVYLSYLVEAVGVPPRIVETCLDASPLHRISRAMSIRGGWDVQIFFCFKLPEALPDDVLLHLKTEMQRKPWLSGATNTRDEELEKFMNKYGDSFRFSDSDEAHIETLGKSKMIELGARLLLQLLASLVGLWGLTFVVGWVVRGFLGIPQGQDRKEIQPASDLR